MKGTDRLAQLDAHQATIAAIMREAGKMLRSPDRDAAGLSRKRWEVTRALMAYQGFKHREIFDPIVAKGAPDEARAARRLKADCIAMGDTVRAYVAHWSAVSVADCWDEYQPAATALIATLRDHMTRERRDAAQLLRTAVTAPMPADQPGIREATTGL